MSWGRIVDEFSEPYRRHWTDYAATFVALAVSVISLWVAIATEKANQKMVDANYRMVAAASWPFLQLESGNNSDDGKHRITRELENAGVGPAKIHSIEIFWRGKAYPSSQALLRACCVSASVRCSEAMARRFRPSRRAAAGGPMASR